ncbi:MAG: response regulator [Candidatus Levyibacteriota bacterium]
MSYIMIVDDDPDIVDALQFVLQDAGYKTKTSQEGEDAEKLTEKDLPELLILDVLLSGKDGRDICQKLKKQPQTKKLPIIMISAHPSAQKSVAQCGADAFLAKPFNVTDLLSTVEKFVSPS